MFMRVSIVLLVLGAVAANHYKVPQQIKAPPKPIALVKYKDTVYQCQGIVTTECGYSIHCGNMSVHCVDKLTIEYLD